MVDFQFAPELGGNVAGTKFDAWRADEGPSAKFRVGVRTYFRRQDRWGLAFYGADADPAYSAIDHAALGTWAHLLEVTVAGEGLGRFTTLNTWDRAAFTFGFLQFAAHVPDGDFVQWFRAMLKHPEAADYFPALRLAGGRIADPSGPLESATSTAGLMNLLNPNGDRVDADEVLNAARLIDWTRRHDVARQAQVGIGVQAFRKILRGAARQVAIDGESDAVCAVVADIRHQGRGGREVWTSIQQALAAGDKLEALLRIGADQYPERCRAVGAAIHAKLISGQLDIAAYRAASGEFETRARAPLTFALGPVAAAAAAPAATSDTWVAFDSAPFPAGQAPGNAVLVSIPSDFAPAQPFIVTLFLPGHDVPPPCSQLDQIGMIPPQVRASRTNTLLLAPRFGPQSQSGKFDQPEALGNFIREASTRVVALLVGAGRSAQDAAWARAYLAEKAPIVIVSFSGGCHTLKHLLDHEAELADRIGGVMLLDSIYGSNAARQPEQAIADWAERAVGRSWLVSLHSTTNGHNNFVMARLQAAGIPFSHGSDWSKSIGLLTPGTMAFSPAQGHCGIPTGGPPSMPVKTMLDRLDPDFAKTAPSS